MSPPNTVTTTGPNSLAVSSLPSIVSAACSRDTPMEKPVAGTGRAETHGPALLVLCLQQQLNLKNRAGVIFEAAHDRRIDTNATFVTASSCKIRNRAEFA